MEMVDWRNKFNDLLDRFTSGELDVLKFYEESIRLTKVGVYNAHNWKFDKVKKG